MSITTTSGCEALGDIDPVLAVGGLADDLDVRLVLEDHPEPGPHELLVVDQDHPDRGAHRSTAGCESSGSRACTRKPVEVGRGLEVAGVQRHPLAHPDQAAPAAGALADVAAPRAALVGDLDVDGARLVRDAHPGTGAAGVLERVGERLLDDPVGGQLDARIDWWTLALHRQLDREAGGAHLLDQATETLEAGHRLARRVVGGRVLRVAWRAQDPEHPAHVGQRLAAGPVDGLERRASAFRSPIERGQSRTGLDDDHADVMGHDVMQLPGDPFAFVVDGPPRALLALRLLEARVLLDRRGVSASRPGPVAERQDDDDGQHRREETGHGNLGCPDDLTKITAVNEAAATRPAATETRRS